MYGEEGGGRFETPANVMTSSALSRLINSDEIPSVVVEKKSAQKKSPKITNAPTAGGPERRGAGMAWREGGRGGGPPQVRRGGTCREGWAMARTRLPPPPPPPASTAFVPAPGGG